jgi:hypothetical protein
MARLSRRKKPGRREYLRASLERRGTSFFMGEPFPACPRASHKQSRRLQSRRSRTLRERIRGQSKEAKAGNTGARKMLFKRRK